jgi:Glycosyl hydrolase family 76
VFWNSRLGW